MKHPPISRNDLTAPEILCERLSVLIGQKFPLTGKTKTDGSTMRHTIEGTLVQYGLPKKAPHDTYTIIPPKKKGIPKLTREFLDSYIVTSGTNYNLQVWNRNPSIDSVQVEYCNVSVYQDTKITFLR